MKEHNEQLQEYRDKCSRMSEFHAKIGLSYLKYLEFILAFKKKVFHYYKDNLEGKFQEIPHDSNYNTIGLLTDLKIPNDIEYRQYYKPLVPMGNSDYVYDNIKCLPSWYGVDYKLVVDKINEYNSGSGKQLEASRASLSNDIRLESYWDL